MASGRATRLYTAIVGLGVAAAACGGSTSSDADAGKQDAMAASGDSGPRDAGFASDAGPDVWIVQDAGGIDARADVADATDEWMPVPIR
jgi:hypothetical protein